MESPPPRPPLSARERLEAAAERAARIPGLALPGIAAVRFFFLLDKACGRVFLRLAHGPGFAPCDVDVPRAGPGAPRIVHAIGNMATGGSARLVADLCSGLGREFAQEVVTWQAPDPPHYIGLPLFQKRATLRPGEILEHFRGYKPDIIHVHYWDHPGDRAWYEQVFYAAGRWGAPVVENVNVPCGPLPHPAVRAYVYVSDWVRRTHGGVGGCERVIYPGTDLSLFSPPKDAPEPGPTAGMVYRLDRDKLGRRSVDPLVLLARQNPRARVLVAGFGPLAGAFARAARKAGVARRFTFLGTVPYARLRWVYARMAVFCAPVVAESFGSTAVHAMAMGVPVAGWAAGALPEVAGDAGLLAEPGDAPGLARLMLDLLEDPARRKSLGEKAARRAAENFSLQGMLSSYRKLS
ncbi:MAG: glycosyltransferase family 4 protein, partial [Deltaproteobacteria bacterium]|nr:glycosyltransferase family 4 protein [Deltaproteobacteria bacterium]